MFPKEDVFAEHNELHVCNLLKIHIKNLWHAGCNIIGKCGKHKKIILKETKNMSYFLKLSKSRRQDAIVISLGLALIALSKFVA